MPADSKSMTPILLLLCPVCRVAVANGGDWCEACDVRLFPEFYEGRGVEVERALAGVA